MTEFGIVLSFLFPQNERIFMLNLVDFGFMYSQYWMVFGFFRSISSPVHTVSSLLLCDAPGFQNPASCGRQTGATFEDLCHNYLQERLQLLFHHTTLVAPRDR